MLYNFNKASFLYARRSDFLVNFGLKSPLYTYSIFFFSIKGFFHTNISFYMFIFSELVVALVRMRLSSSLYECDCCRLCAMGSCVISVQ